MKSLGPPCCRESHYLIFYGWVVFHCAYTAHLYPPSYQWTFTLLPEWHLFTGTVEGNSLFSFPFLHPELNSLGSGIPLKYCSKYAFLYRTCDFLTVSPIDGIQSYIEIFNLKFNSQPCSLLPSFTDPSWRVFWNVYFLLQDSEIFGGQRKLMLES